MHNIIKRSSEAVSQRWMAVILQPSGGAALKTDTFLWSYESSPKFFMEIINAVSSGLKRRGTIWLIISSQFKKPASMTVWDCISAHGVLAQLVLMYTRCTQVWREHMLPSESRSAHIGNGKWAPLPTALKNSADIKPFNICCVLSLY